MLYLPSSSNRALTRGLVRMPCGAANALLGRGIAIVGSCLDVFKNNDHILRARCRVAICHGTEDEVVPCWNVSKTRPAAPPRLT